MASVLSAAVNILPVAKLTMIPPFGCVATAGAMVMGWAGEVVCSRVAVQLAGVVLVRSNFHSLPSTSPA